MALIGACAADDLERWASIIEILKSQLAKVAADNCQFEQQLADKTNEVEELRAQIVPRVPERCSAAVQVRRPLV